MRAGELRVPLADVAVGEHCHVRRSACDDRVLTHGVVTRVDHGVATLALIGAPVRLAADVVVAATGQPLQVALGTHLLGCVLDGFGEVVERLRDGDPLETAGLPAPVQAAPLDYRQRRAIQVPFATGIRALDALLTVGEGQRMGIFAAAGCGKTTLVEMLLGHADCDVRVVALVGERGREVASFVDAIRNGPAAARTIIVQATSDSSPATRVNAAMVATRVAEYFRDQGSRVLLVMDSATAVQKRSRSARSPLGGRAGSAGAEANGRLSRADSQAGTCGASDCTSAPPHSSRVSARSACASSGTTLAGREAWPARMKACNVAGSAAEPRCDGSHSRSLAAAIKLATCGRRDHKPINRRGRSSDGGASVAGIGRRRWRINAVFNQRCCSGLALAYSACHGR